MLEQGKISCSQTVYLLVNLVAATSVVYLPAITAVTAGRDAWLTSVVATAPGVYLALVLCSLGKRFAGQTLIQYLQTLLGTWPGRVLGILYVFYFLYTNGLIVREFGELMVSMVLPRTPLMVLHAVILLLSAYAVRGGLEVLARSMELTVPQMMVFFSVMIALVANQMDLRNLTPLLENGLTPVFKASLPPTGWRGEIILLAMFIPYLARPGQAGRCAIISVFAIGLFLTASSVADISVFGPMMPRLTFPAFALVRQISVAQFLERVDAVMVIVWVVSMYGKIALFYYAAVLGAAQVANLRDYRPLVLPVGVLLAAYSYQGASNSVELVEHIAKVWPLLALVFEYILPTSLLVLAVARGIKPVIGDNVK